jgi:hypothetical protein
MKGCQQYSNEENKTCAQHNIPLVYNEDFGVLIGMSIINKGDFSISNYDNKTTLSFRIPSVKETDYTKEKPVSHISPPRTNRNDRCPCNSGKKYKNCCINKVA